MSRRHSLVGQLFTRLEVFSDGPLTAKHKSTSWCKCKCGSPAKLVQNADLVRGGVKSCGCLLTDVNKAKARSWEDELKWFWSCHNVVPGKLDSPCWEWTHSTAGRGYGRFKYLSQRRLAHRFAWEVTNGPIPADVMVCHLCDNPPCHRPDHLFLGTNQINQDDSVMKGRHYRGKLLPSDVIEIRRTVRLGLATQIWWTRHLKLAKGTISKIVSGQRWKRVIDQSI